MSLSQRWTHKACFEFYGTTPKNPRWSWSGRSSDGKVVAVTFWQDQFENGGRVYRARRPGDPKWLASPGRTELLENLKWAKEHCDGVLRIIIAIAKDASAEPRSIRECFPQKNLIMRLVHLDEATGDFMTERVE